VDAARYYEAGVIIRGIRAVTDMEKEFQFANTNRILSFSFQSEIDTAFFMPDDKFTYLSSSTVRELVKFGRDVSEYTTSRAMIELQKQFEEIARNTDEVKTK